MPEAYLNGMEPWEENEVRKVSHVWRDGGGRAWLVVFDLANLGGRIECVGVAVRSSLGALRDPRCMGADLYSPLWEWIDPEPVPAAGEGVSLRPLQAVTLRQFPLAETLERARHEYAGLLQQFAQQLAELPELPPWADLADYEETAKTYEASTRRPGRPSKYSAAWLRTAAGIYEGAVRSGERAPTKLMGDSLGLTPNQAKKVVQRCRRAGLLLPTARGKAGGVRPRAAAQRRVCAHPGCQTQLSKYTLGAYCGAHVREHEEEDL